MKPTIQINVERRVPLEQLTDSEVTVLPEYLATADSIDEALEEFYWRVPIEDHSHFTVSAIEVDEVFK